jgi:arginyl-tRNA synthetase
MTSIVTQLETFFRAALVRMMGEDGRTVDPLIRVSGDDKFGDYQSNVAMGLAKKLGSKPRDVAQQLVDALAADPQVAVLCEPFEIAGPGFINIRLRTAWLSEQINAVPPSGDDDRLGLERVSRPDTVVVDYSSPNIAKQMHVGHIRSTIIGDAIARMIEFQGHKVIRQNHIGDWGTQFGMLIALLREKLPDALTQPERVHLEDLEAFYREASARDKEDPAFAERARQEVVKLHHKDPDTMRAWQYIVDESRRHYMPIYQRLGVSLTPADERGESFYADRLPGVVKELEDGFGAAPAGPPAGVDAPAIHVTESDGALCVFHYNGQEPAFKGPEGNAFPMIIRKSDGAYLYATTDLAGVVFRTRELKADRIIYVTDARQALHFSMVFATARAAGWTLANQRAREVKLEHVTFGSILGEDRKPFKTRGGETVKLAELLDEAVSRSEALIRASEADPEKKRGFTEEEIRDIAEAVGIGAVKYADLSQNRQSDYVFSWEKMLALEGNTAPYLMYAYARIRSIYRRGAESGAVTVPTALVEPAERSLARQILRFPDTLENAAATLKINLLTDYLYELAGLFMRFYESCPVLGAPTPEARASRLRLCDLTARTLRIGLGLLGIRVVERM